MKRFAACLIATAFCAGAAHADMDFHGGDCGLHSDYSLDVNADNLTFTRRDAHPGEVVIAHGTLRIDGRELAVNAADRQRLLDIEHGVRDTLPDVKAIAHDAIAIAFDAVGEVSAAFARDTDAARASAQRLARAARELDQRIGESTSFNDWKDGDFERLMENAVGTLVGEVVANVAGQAVAVALSGDQRAVAELEARADGIDKKVNAIVEKRAKNLELRAEGLCPRMHRLARLEQGLDVRLEDGGKLGLVSVK